MDVEFGENTGCVILSLMGVDDRPRKKLIREHKSVLSNEYHQRVALMASHVRRSSFKCYSFGTGQNCETSEASAAIGQNKLCKRSINEEEEMSDVASYERKTSGGMGLVDEHISGIYSSHKTARHYPLLDNLSEPSINLRMRFSHKRSFGSSYTDNRYEDCLGDLFNARLGGYLPKSQSSAASSVVSSARESVKGGENVASDSTTESEDAVGKLHVKAKRDGEERLPGNPDMPGVPTSLVISKRNSDPSPADATDQVYEIEQESSLFDSEDSYCTKEMSSDIISKLYEQGTRLHSFRFPSTACSGEIGTTILNDEGRDDQHGDGSTIQDDSRPARIRENREFHYLMEILTEAGFCRRNLASSLDKWHTLESPLSPFVFEMVEKSYTDDKSWEASERVLLFDRMNYWLGGILRGLILVPSRNVFGSINDRFRPNEEVLWRSLVIEGKALKRETIEDLLASDLGLLDLAEFIESIIAEIEWSAIDVLVAELVAGE